MNNLLYSNISKDRIELRYNLKTQPVVSLYTYSSLHFLLLYKVMETVMHFPALDPLLNILNMK